MCQYARTCAQRAKKSPVATSHQPVLACAGRERIEALLAFGASRTEAAAGPVARATAAAMAPTLQQLSGAGLVVVPSLLAGQLLAGAQPAQVLTRCCSAQCVACRSAAAARGKSETHIGACVVLLSRRKSPASQASYRPPHNRACAVPDKPCS